MTDHNEVADLLDGAADIIERDGWCQGALRERRRCLCPRRTEQGCGQ
jgi:hypothetical protein